MLYRDSLHPPLVAERPVLRLLERPVRHRPPLPQRGQAMLPNAGWRQALQRLTSVWR